MPRRTPVRADKTLVAGTDSVFVLPKSARADRRIMVASFCQIDLKQATGGRFAGVERAKTGCGWNVSSGELYAAAHGRT
jgi:hypothetical protein